MEEYKINAANTFAAIGILKLFDDNNQENVFNLFSGDQFFKLFKCGYICICICIHIYFYHFKWDIVLTQYSNH